MDKKNLIPAANVTIDPDRDTSSVKDDSATSANTIQVGLSACLAGQEVRYNGGHCRSNLCLNTLGQHFKFTTFCPEVAAGFGTPRPTMRLVGDPDNPKLTYSDDDNSDLTSQLVDAFTPKLAGFSALDGYILMKNSPSCGMERIKVFQENGYPHQQRGQGLFTAALQKHHPLLPVEEAGRLNDARLRENFILRVFAHHHFRTEVLSNPNLHNLIKFHSSYKYVLMAHHQNRFRALGRMLAVASDQPIGQVIESYFSGFMKVLSKSANAKNHSNTLMHILGYLKKTVPSQARQHIVGIIHQYRAGHVPLITPLTLLRHYIDQSGSDYIRAQRYLQPYPASLGLNNWI